MDLEPAPHELKKEHFQEAPRNLPSVRRPASFRELTQAIKDLTPTLRDVIARRRVLETPSEIIETLPKFERAFGWLRESFKQLESDCVRGNFNDKPDDADFFLYLTIRKGVECDLQLLELRDIALEHQRKQIANESPPKEDHIREAQKIVDGFREAIATLGRTLPLLGVDNCYDTAEIRVRMLTAYGRLYSHCLKSARILPQESTNYSIDALLRSVRALIVHTGSALENTRLYLERQIARGTEDQSRYQKHLEMLPTLRATFDHIWEKFAPLNDAATTARAMVLEARQEAAQVQAQTALAGWQAFAAENHIEFEKITEERLWTLHKLQRRILELYYGTSEIPVRRDWRELARALTEEGFAHFEQTKLEELFASAVAQLKAWESGWHWIASICRISVRDVKNRFKLASIAEGEAALLYFGIGGPRQDSNVTEDSQRPLTITTFLDRIRGTQGEAWKSLRHRPKQTTLSERLRSVLSDIFVVNSQYSEEQICHHLVALDQFSAWDNADAVLDLALSSARYLHYQGEKRAVLLAACATFFEKIPFSLWRAQANYSLVKLENLEPLSTRVSDSASDDIASSTATRIVRTLLVTDRINFLGEIILGTRMKLYSASGLDDPSKYSEAREHFITAKYMLAAGLSKEFMNRAPREDLIHESIPALIAAVESYEPSLGLRFSSHAYLPMHTAMKRLVQREVRNRFGINMKMQDRLNSFVADCINAGVQALDLEISNERIAEILKHSPRATARSVSEIQRLRAVLCLSQIDGEETSKDLPGCTISMNTDLDQTEHQGDTGPEREIADENVPVVHDPDALKWICASMRAAWEKVLFASYLDTAQLERDLQIFGEIHFSAKSFSASEIALREGVHKNTVHRAVQELKALFSLKVLSLATPDAQLIPLLQAEVTNHHTLERNLRFFRLASQKRVSSAELALRYEIDDSSVRLVYRKMRALAEEIGVAKCSDADAVIRALRDHCTSNARRRAVEAANLRMNVIERVANAEGDETLQDIGTAFGFGESNVRQILVQAREIAKDLDLR